MHRFPFRSQKIFLGRKPVALDLGAKAPRYSRLRRSPRASTLPLCSDNLSLFYPLLSGIVEEIANADLVALFCGLDVMCVIFVVMWFLCHIFLWQNYRCYLFMTSLVMLSPVSELVTVFVTNKKWFLFYSIEDCYWHFIETVTPVPEKPLRVTGSIRLWPAAEHNLDDDKRRIISLEFDEVSLKDNTSYNSLQ